MKFKIISITQVYNELEKSNLTRFFKYLKPLVDEIVIYDDCSTDGSFEYSLSQTEHVIRGFKNNFENEIEHRNILIKKALELNPDFILWVDADEVLSKGSEEILQQLCEKCVTEDYDGVQFHQINLWRSNSWKRIDSLYNDGIWTRLWRSSENLRLESDKLGLHQNLVPTQIKKTFKQKSSFYLHYGFSSERNLAFKYLTYKKYGQSGYEQLERLIDEKFLELKKVNLQLLPDGLNFDDVKPEKLSYLQSRKYVEIYREAIEKPKFSIVCLIYKSVKWLKLVHEQINKYTDLSDKEFFFIANDANDEVLNYLKQNYIKHYTFNATENQKKEWYINNVYRAWNFGASKAKGEYIVFVNSDMCFSPGWFEALVASYNGKNIISSRLVESGRLRSGIYGIEKNFGTNTENYNEQGFIKFVDNIRTQKIKPGGLYMPLFIKKTAFFEVNGYPEGNLKVGADIYSKNYAEKGDKLISGDTVFIEKLKNIGINHVTAFDSLVYHFQEGEMLDTDLELLNQKKEIAVVNDYCRGINHEKVFWNFLLENLEGTYKLDIDSLGEKEFNTNVHSHITENTSIIIQNASFINRASKNHFTIMFLQDDLRAMRKSSKIQENNLYNADLIVSNSIQTSISYKEFDIKVVPIGVDQELFKPLDKESLRKKYQISNEKKVGIFVGSFSEVKGWSKVKKCIESRADITWILVSKYKENFSHDNVIQFSNLSQEKLVELLNCADFFILGSPVETQCLAAIEANLCNVPVVMPKVGIYKDFDSIDLEKLGEFDTDLMAAIERLSFENYSPRKTIIEKELTIENTINLWKEILSDCFKKIDNQLFIKKGIKPSFNSSKFYKRVIIEFFISLKKYSYLKARIKAVFRKFKKIIKQLLRK